MSESGFRIFLEDLHFYSYIGVGEQERVVGNEFIVSVAVFYDAAGYEKEILESSISYADLYEEVRCEMKKERMLLETVAVDICERISTRWQQVDEINVKIIKDKAPVTGLIGNCGVEYFWKKS